ncbi:MAG: hypothetical protein MZV63_56220 [Marinilabiliales bacterium]|nr:hypothetical protein [Marinilabiliales bacterium]
MTPLIAFESGPTGDNSHMDVDVGFTFVYLGTNYTNIRINTNGWISLNLSGSDAESPDNSRLFTSGNPNTTLAPWWDDLMADGSSAVAWTSDRDLRPNRVCIAEWKDVLPFQQARLPG